MANFSSRLKALGSKGNLPTLFPDPIRSQRPPVNGSDKGIVGQLWIDESGADVYCCVAPTTWADIGATSGSFVNVIASGYVEAGGNIYTTGGDIIADTGDIEATLGSVTAGTTVTAGTGISATTGDITADVGDIVATLGNVDASAGDVIGNTLQTSNATTNLIIQDNTISAAGSDTDIDVEITPKGNGLITLGSALEFGSTGPQIFVGSGAPSASVPKGSLYLRTDGSGVNDRAYIATDAVGTWTAIVTVG